MCSTKLEERKEEATLNSNPHAVLFEKPAQTAKIDEVGILSYITFGWIFDYLWKAYKNQADPAEVWPCSIFDSANVNCTRLEHLWNEELKTNPERPSLFKAIFKFMKYRLVIACLIFLFCLTFGFIGPTCLVRGLIAFTESPPMEEQGINYIAGIYLAVAILVVEMSRVLMYGATWAVSYRTGIRVRGAVLALLYKNLLHSKTLRGKTPAEVVNVFANDGQRIFDAVTFAPLVLMGPFVIIGGIVYLLKVIGPLSLLGLLVFLVFDVIQVFLGITMMRCRNLAIVKTENRMKLMGEVLRNIRVIKMSGWENVFMQKVVDARREEERNLKIAGYAQSLAIASGTIVPVVATVVTVLAVVLSGHDLLASDIFSAITVFVVMLFGIRMIPYGARYLAEARSAITKIQEMLLFEKFEPTLVSEVHSQNAIVLRNAAFAFDENTDNTSTGSENAEAEKLNSEQKFALHDLELAVAKGSKVGICGPVGGGKSSLLQALLGCMSKEKGQMSIAGTVAYVAQNPCVMSGTVRDNILFGLPMNSQRYSKVIAVSQLTKDLEQLPQNEKSEVGERGAALSGGQKARVALARAFYATRDVYLLDDVFSAINKEVATKIFAEGINEFLANKTVLLVTSNPTLLAKCDSVLFVKDGNIQAQGPHEELSKSNKEYSDVFSEVVLSKTDESSAKSDDADKEFANQLEKSEEDEKEEDLGLQSISKDVYFEYIQAAGGVVVLVLVLLLFVVNVGANIFGTFWLSKWMKDVHGSKNGSHNLAEDESLSYYSWIYVLSIVVLFVSGLVKAMVFVKLSIRASTNLHIRMLNSVVHAVTLFFDITPTGRILNRFSKDLDEVDVKLPFSSEALLQYMITCVGLLLTIVWVFPLLVVSFLPLSALFIVFFLCFRAGIRSLKRTENVTRSPVFDHVSSSLDGLSTVHSFVQHIRFVETFKAKLDENSTVMLMFNSAMRWQAVWLDLLVVAVSFLVSCLIVFLTGRVEPSDAGMALAFALQMSGIFQFAVRSQTELESKLTAVERISHYAKNIEQEELSGATNPPETWPQRGTLKLSNIVLRYRAGARAALDHVSFELVDKDKVLVVGRTGSGKSSIVNAVLRLYNTESGQIVLDGVDIGDISLPRLRHAITVIPQGGGLFNGPLRFNLDPEQGCTDDQMWDALEKVAGTTEKLELAIEDQGRNLSAGQRQLVCVARALLRDSRLVVLDEATSNLDIRTDLALQKIIKETFDSCTVLLISHRPENSIEIEKVLQVEDGQATMVNQSEKTNS